MKNKNIIIIVVVIILLIGGGLYLNMNKTPKTTQTTQPATTSTVNNNTNTQTTNTNNQNEEIEGSLKNLLANGKTVNCTFSNNTNDVNITGTVYAANGKIREDYKTTMKEAGAISGHMIVDSQEAYMWTDQMNQGFKFSLAGMPSPSSGQKNQAPDINKTMHFSCLPWTVDSSLFTLPSNINFQSMSIPAVQSTGAAGGTKTNTNDLSSQCGVCNNIPEGPGRTACKTQLKCP